MSQSVNPATSPFQPVRRLAKRMLGRHRQPGDVIRTRYNVNQLQALEAALNRNGWSFPEFSSILDFGCGAGRLSQYLCWLAPNSQIFGCDIDPEAVSEAKRLCPHGQFHANNSLPPLAFDNEQFDLIWSYSVFTNISEVSQKAWLEELARVLRPGGVMLHTLHSHDYVKRAALFSPDLLKKYQFPGSPEEFAKLNDGYYFISPDNWPAEEGFTLISRNYVATRWPEYTGLSLVGYSEAVIESYPEGCHDVVILAKDPIQRHF